MWPISHDRVFDAFGNFDRLIEACNELNTRVVSVKMSPNTNGPVELTPNNIYTNEGANSQVEFTLPDMVPGVRCRIYVQNDYGVLVSGGSIRLGESVGTQATSIKTGSYLELVAINLTEWVSTLYVGEWDVI